MEKISNMGKMLKGIGYIIFVLTILATWFLSILIGAMFDNIGAGGIALGLGVLYIIWLSSKELIIEIWQNKKYLIFFVYCFMIFLVGVLITGISNYIFLEVFHIHFLTAVINLMLSVFGYYKLALLFEKYRDVKVVNETNNKIESEQNKIKSLKRWIWGLMVVIIAIITIDSIAIIRIWTQGPKDTEVIKAGIEVNFAQQENRVLWWSDERQKTYIEAAKKDDKVREQIRKNKKEK